MKITYLIILTAIYFLKKIGEPKFKIGDKIIISKYKKGYTPNWTKFFFIVYKVQPTKPITYKLADLMLEEYKAPFCDEETQKPEQKICRIENVLKRDKNKALVKWKGYPDELNSWVKDIQIS